MSSRRSSSRPRPPLSRERLRDISEDEINNLVGKLQQLLQVNIRRRCPDNEPAENVLQETCNYIRTLHREAEDLSDQLAQLLATADITSSQATILRNLLSQ